MIYYNDMCSERLHDRFDSANCVQLKRQKYLPSLEGSHGRLKCSAAISSRAIIGKVIATIYYHHITWSEFDEILNDLIH